MKTPPVEQGPHRENLGNACEMQALQLSSMQAAHQAELYSSGVAGRSLGNLSEKEQKAITDAAASGVLIRLSIYSHTITYDDGRPTTHEYGIRFIVPRSDGNPLFVPEGRYYAPVATIDNGNVAAYGADQSREALHDACVVYSLAYELITARHSGQLPDLSGELTTILDTTRPYTPSPIISR